MNTYEYRVMISVQIEAFDEHDAEDALKDVFGEGELCGIVVRDFEVTDFEMLD